MNLPAPDMPVLSINASLNKELKSSIKSWMNLVTWEGIGSWKNEKTNL